jgi:hypothetical protein
MGAVLGLVLVACGGAAAPGSGNVQSGSIPSMPAYPSATQTKTEAPPPAKPKDPKEICAGAADVKIAGAATHRALFGGDDAKGLAELGALSPAKGKELSMGELQALEKKGAWEELLSHAEDIPPSQRGAAWEKLIERAATAYMASLVTNTAAWEGVFTSQAFIKRYPHLMKSTEFMAKRGDAAKIAAEQCLRDSYRGKHCIDMMTDFLKTSNTGAEVGFAFGKITRKNQNHYVAVPFFKWALEQKKDAAWCGDEDLKLAVIAGLGLPADYDNAGGARSIAANTCFDALKADITKQLKESPEGYYRDNACAVLKAKGGL